MDIQKGSHNCSIDVVRAIAIIAVLVCHTSIEIERMSEYQRLFFFAIGKFGVPFFFLISGYLNIREKNNSIDFLRKRANRILIPFLLWVVLYGMYNYFNGGKFGGDLLLCSPSAHLWYIYALMGLYLITPVLSSFFSNCSRGMFQFYLLCSAVPFFVDYYNLKFEATLINEHSIIYIFNHLAGYLFYYLLGAYCWRFKDCWLVNGYCKKFILRTLGLFALFLMILYVGNKYFGFTPYQLTRYATPGVLVYAVACWHLLYNLKVRSRIGKKMVEEVSTTSFGVYLVHMFIVFAIIPVFIDIIRRHNLIGLPVFCINCVAPFVYFSLSYIIVKLMMKIPYSKYIIG